MSSVLQMKLPTGIGINYHSAGTLQRCPEENCWRRWKNFSFMKVALSKGTVEVERRDIRHTQEGQEGAKVTNLNPANYDAPEFRTLPPVPLYHTSPPHLIILATAALGVSTAGRTSR